MNIPVCVEKEDEYTMELQSWPVLPPSQMVSLLIFSNVAQFFLLVICKKNLIGNR